MPDDPKPSIVGQTITFQSILQYVLMAFVGLLSYFQYETSKSAAWARAEVVDARKEAADDRDKAAVERETLRKNFDQALSDLREAKSDQKVIKASVARVEKTGEATKKAVENLEP